MVDIRKSPDIQERVFEYVARRTPVAENVRVVNIQEKFLNGTLYTISFDVPGVEDEPSRSYINRVFVRKDPINVYGHDDDLLRIVGETHSRSFYDVFANGDVVSGIIALVVTVLIVPSFLISYWTASAIAVPDWITSGWLLILGFYFGKASSRSD